MDNIQGQASQRRGTVDDRRLLQALRQRHEEVAHDQHVPGADQGQLLITLGAGSGEVVYHATSAAGTVAPLESTE